MSNWLLLIVVGLIVYAVTLAPFFPPAWRAVAQALGGILVAVGLVLLVFGLLGAGVA